MFDILRNIRSGLRSQPLSWPALIGFGVVLVCVLGWTVVTGEDFRGSFASLILLLAGAGYAFYAALKRGRREDQPPPTKKTPLEKLQEWDERDSPF
jgi:hypothetical protein